MDLQAMEPKDTLESQKNEKYLEVLWELENHIKSLPDSIPGDELPTEHSFCEGLYIRTFILPKGFYCMGALHKDAFTTFFSKGEISLLTPEGIQRVVAPKVLISPANTKRFGFAHEEVVWSTIHPNPDNCRDLDILFKRICIFAEDIGKDKNEVSMETKELFLEFNCNVLGVDRQLVGGLE